MNRAVTLVINSSRFSVWRPGYPKETWPPKNIKQFQLLPVIGCIIATGSLGGTLWLNSYNMYSLKN